MTGISASSRIYLAGHGGLVGRAIFERLEAGGYSNVAVRTHGEVDLTEQASVARLFSAIRPEHVILCAAKVGGILANMTAPAEFIRVNLAIQTNVIHEAWRHGVERLLFLGSACIYPRDCPQPMREEHLLTGPLEATNRPYAVAKIAGIETCWAYNRQHGTRYLAIMPTNLYGPGDNYDLETSHVLPALIRKFHEAKERGDAAVTVWGTGAPRRDFLFNRDLADAAIFLMERDDAALAPVLNDETPPLINIGCGQELTIRELVEVVRETVGFDGALRWDREKPDGVRRKLLDGSRMTALGWGPKTSLREGIRIAYEDYRRHLPAGWT